MTDLGYLIWWKVGDVDLDHDQLEKVLDGTGIPLPARPIPIDVYRRITNQTRVYNLDGEVLELTTVPIDSKSDKMLTRHMVGTLKSPTGTPRLVRKVGDLAFYKPPRGKNSKSRMRVTSTAPYAEWSLPIQDFTNALQADYEQGVKGALDGQAIRRLVRAHLDRHGALYVDGPYFVRDEDARMQITARLVPLFDALSVDSFMTYVPMPASAMYDEFLARYEKKEDG